jgi:Trp operon repressor
LNLLFTEKELNDFSDRIDILKMLNNGNTQREISSEV